MATMKVIYNMLDKMIQYHNYPRPNTLIRRNPIKYNTEKNPKNKVVISKKSNVFCIRLGTYSSESMINPKMVRNTEKIKIMTKTFIFFIKSK